MDSDEGKIFIGGISWDMTEEKLRGYFGNYGEVLQTFIMKDKSTGRPRGFAFVVFADPSVPDRVIKDKHYIDGKTVDAKRALSREEQLATGRLGIPNSGRVGGGGGGNIRTKKIFVGGLPPTLIEEEFKLYFENYGSVQDVVVMYDQNTQRPRGFGFVTFVDEDAVDRVLHKTFHELNGKMVEVKRALPKDANLNGGSGGRLGGGENYQSYGGGSGANTNSYDARMDANRYMQPQVAGGAYPSYGLLGYGAPTYGYSAANNGIGYGGYGLGGYSGAPSGPYGNTSAPAGGYLSGPPGAPRSPWSNQAPAGYGSSGYGSAPNWNGQSGGGGAAATSTGQSPNAATGYGNQGYGGYSGAEGLYGHQGGYSVAGPRSGSVGAPNANQIGGAGEQGAVPGYMGSSGGYGDANGVSGCSSAWRSDPSQAGYGSGQVNSPPGCPASYGAGYGGVLPRQAQQQ